MGSLFPEVDHDKTIERCKKHFERTLPRMVRVSGTSISALKSPATDGMPKAPSTENHADVTIVRRLYAEQVVRRTIEAISHCSSRSKEVLDLLYLQDYSDTMVWMSIGYSRSHYFDHIKPDALLEFADTYMLDDLHVYKLQEK